MSIEQRTGVAFCFGGGLYFGDKEDESMSQHAGGAGVTKQQEVHNPPVTAQQALKQGQGGAGAIQSNSQPMQPA